MKNNKLLVVKDLAIEVKGREILNNVNLEIANGEVHALVGPNGHGKSTLLLTLMNHFAYKVTKGEINFLGKDIVNEDPDVIARMGMFLGFQSPMPIPGLKTIDFLRAVVDSHLKKPIGSFEYYKKTTENMKNLALDRGVLQREVNVNFSGGEKKKHEILQMLMLESKLVLLDEIDSGLDVDNINEIIRIVNKHHRTTPTSYLIVSHYDKMFNTMDVDYTHLVYNKQVLTVKGGDLIKKIHEGGYAKVVQSLGLPLVNIDDEEEVTRTTLEACGIREKI